jgi:hypothetical protein
MLAQLVQFISDHGRECMDVGLPEDRLMVSRDGSRGDRSGDVSIPSKFGPAPDQGTERGVKDRHGRGQLGWAVATHDPGRAGLVPRIIETAWPAALHVLTACQRSGFHDRATREMGLSSYASNQRLAPQHAVASSDAPTPAERLWGQRVEEYEQLDARAGSD